MTTPNIVAEVKADIERVRPVVTHLAHVDAVFWQIEAIIQINPAIRDAEVLSSWLGHCYTDAIVMGLRRLVDDDRQVVSLTRILQKVKSRASDFRREWFVEMSAVFLRSEADGWFTEVAGGRHARLPAERVQAWQDYLKARVGPVEQFANDYVAHSSLAAADPLPSFHDVRLALVAVFRTLQWLVRLTSGGVLTTAVPTIQTNWLQALRAAWLPAGQPVPPYQHLDDLAQTDCRVPR